MRFATLAALGFVVLAGAPGCLGKTRLAAPPASSESQASVNQVLRKVVTPTAVELETRDGFVRITSPQPDVFRFHFARQRGARALPSFAVDAAALAEERPLRTEESGALVLHSEGSMLRIDEQPLRIDLLNAGGTLLVQDALRVSCQKAGLTLDWALAEGERIYGLGDKVGGFDRRGHGFELWNTDAYGWKVDADPLYKSIPFLLFANSGLFHGLFIDHPARAALDLGLTRADRASYSARAGDALDVYLFGNSGPKGVIEAYTRLTGRTPLPPLWALGHHQSRYGYMNEGDVRSVVRRMQQDKIPLDAVWLDIDYQDGNAPFTVSPQAFPGFAKLVADLRATGVRTVAITDLHVKSYQGKPSAGYAPYDSGAAGDHFIRAGNGFFEGPVWPGASVFPEFTRERTRAWWGGLYQRFVEQGVSGFWNDMNEPALFVPSKTFPESVEHRLDDGTTASHLLLHNAYGSLNARATYEGVLRLRPNERPFILTRAAYAGIQKYAASWTGDNTADRAHLAVTIPQLLNLGVSGYPFNGADVGGFVGCPDPELFASWMELGALQPFFRNHSAKDACRREPWLFGAAIEARARKAVERRYRLLPYLYTLFEESSQSGAPIMRPLWLEYPFDRAAYENDRVYLLGRDLLVVPQLQAEGALFDVSLPPGEWYDVETSERLSGGAHQLPRRPADSVRLLARAGAVVPQQALVQSTRDESSLLELHVWPHSHDCGSSLYVDDGSTFAYQGGAFRRIAYECEKTAGSFSLSASSSGSYLPRWSEVQVIFHGVSERPKAIKDVVTGQALPLAYDAARKAVSVRLPGAVTDFRISASL